MLHSPLPPKTKNAGWIFTQVTPEGGSGEGERKVYVFWGEKGFYTHAGGRK
jgi:hypothetical protein